MLDTIISFITISADLDDLLFTRNSTLSIIQDLNLKEYNLIFVIAKSELKKNKLKVDTLINSINTYVCFDNQEGIYKAMNIGISKSLELNSTHICFINGGDKLDKGFIHSYQICIKNPKAIIGGKNKIIYKKSIKKNIFYEGGRTKWSINHQGSIYPSNLFRKNKYLSFLRISADWHFNYNLRNKCEFIKHKYNVAFFDYSTGISQSSNISQLLLLDEIKVIKKYFSKPKYLLSIVYISRLMVILMNFIKEIINVSSNKFNSKDLTYNKFIDRLKKNIFK